MVTGLVLVVEGEFGVSSFEEINGEHHDFTIRYKICIQRTIPAKGTTEYDLLNYAKGK